MVFLKSWGRPAPNPFIPFEGFYTISSSQSCIQNDFPVHCPWETLEVRTNRQVTCLKFKDGASLQHYCFESLDSSFEKADYSQSGGAQWDYQLVRSKESRTMKQVSVKSFNKSFNSKEFLLKMEEYTWQDISTPLPAAPYPSGGPRVQIDLKVHLLLQKSSLSL
jgi:hypothetical protein